MSLSSEIAYVGAPLDFKIDRVISVPVLNIVYHDLHGLDDLHGVLVFTSKRGIVSLKKSGVSIEGTRIYCIGSQTAQYLHDLYSMECIVPGIQSTEGLADLLTGRERSVHIIGSDQTSKHFIDKLKSSGVDVKNTIAYRIEENSNIDYEVLKTVRKILVGSSKSFEVIHRNAGNMIRNMELYAIGKPTENAMISFGYQSKGCFETPDIRVILRRLLTKR